MKHKIEIFSAGCAICQEAIETVKTVANPESEVHVLDMHNQQIATRAKQHGILCVPAVVIDGKLADCCVRRGVDEHVLREALR
jgi:hypothetical protein